MQLTLDSNEILEHKFSISFFKFTQSFNYLDINLALCISHFVTTYEPTAAYPRLQVLSTHGKMECLQKLIFDRFHETNVELVNLYNQWFAKASEKRIARNNFIHGVWDIGLPGEKPIRFNITTWNTDLRKSKSQSQDFSLEEFEAITKEMDDIFYSFMDLKKKIV